VGAAVALTLVATSAVASAGSAKAHGSTFTYALRSDALASPLRFAVYMPPGYATSGMRYPVVYFLHGLPASASAFRDIGLARNALDELERRALVVAPQGARDDDSDAEYLDWGAGRNWESAIAKELPAYVDRHFRTIAGRRGRAIVGISAGGYGALAIGLHHLTTFSVIESWSGYGQPTNPAGTKALDLGSAQANRRASIHANAPLLRRAFAARPTFLAFFVAKGDSRFYSENVRLDRELSHAGVPHVFAVYRGGHDRKLWARHSRHWLALALRRLATARK
jgi:S-formylglutathione hydrolase FrmB